jgi:hypothetical protein
VSQTSAVSYRRWIHIIVVVCTSFGWMSGVALAQNAAPDVLPRTAPSTLWLLEGRKYHPEPHLVLGMIDRASFSVTGRETTLPSEGAIPASSFAEITSSPPELSRIHLLPLGPEDLANNRSKPASASPSVQRASNRNAGIGGFPDHASAEGSFLTEDRMKQVLSKQWLESDESFTSEDEYDSSPLVQFKLGDWQFPVALSTAAISR